MTREINGFLIMGVLNDFLVLNWLFKKQSSYEYCMVHMWFHTIVKLVLGSVMPVSPNKNYPLRVGIMPTPSDTES